MYKYLASIVLLFFALFAKQNLSAQTNLIVDKVPMRILEKYPYGVTFLKESQLDSIMDYADTDLVPIIFKRDKTDLILPNTALDSIVSVVNEILRDSDVSLKYVWIGGSASPEGPEKHNEWLGKTRAQRLYDYFTSHTSLPDSLIRVDNLMEDWRTPLRLIEKDEFPNKDIVLEIWATEKDNATRKKKIMAIDNGVTWEYLIDKPFRPARNARMVIVCNAMDAIAIYPGYEPKINLNLPLISNVPLVIPQFERKEYRGQFIALKTNIATLGLLVANLGLEVSFGNGFSIDLPFYYSPYDITSTFRVRIMGTQPELRYWLNHNWPGKGHFFGLNGTVSGFDISFPHNSRRFQDPEHALWGAGVSYGYALNFGESKRWGLEFNIGVGYMNYKYDTFVNKHNGRLLKTSSTQNYFGITRLGINLTYKWWKVKEKKGKEVIL